MPFTYSTDNSWNNIFFSKYFWGKLAEHVTDKITVDEPKIIVISGSSSAFGLDQNMLEEATGYKVDNLGLQANIGPRFLAIVLYMSIFATANAITVAGNVDVRQQFIYFQF